MVAGDLVDDEAVVGQILVEGPDDPVAIPPNRVELVGVADQVEPVPRPSLAISGRGEEPVDDLGEGIRGGVRQEHGGIVRGVEVIAESRRLAPRERIAIGILLRRHRSLERLQIGNEMHDLFRAQDAGRAPRRHRRVGEEHPRIPDDLIEVLVGQLPVADGGLVGADAAGRPHLVSRNQMTARARPLGAAEKHHVAQSRIARHAGRHRHGLHRRLRAPVVVGVGPEVEVACRPAAVADRQALAVRQHLKLAARLGCGARRPRRNARGVGRVDGRPGARGAERDKRHPAHHPPCGRVTHAIGLTRA